MLVTCLKTPDPCGSSGIRFDDFLKEEGIYDEVRTRVLKRVLAEHVAAAKRYRSFIDEAVRADIAMQKSGVGYTMPKVHKYVATKIRGERVTRPRPVKWRK